MTRQAWAPWGVSSPAWLSTKMVTGMWISRKTTTRISKGRLWSDTAAIKICPSTSRLRSQSLMPLSVTWHPTFLTAHSLLFFGSFWLSRSSPPILHTHSFQPAGSCSSKMLLRQKAFIIFRPHIFSTTKSYVLRTEKLQDEPVTGGGLWPQRFELGTRYSGPATQTTPQDDGRGERLKCC